jgi:molybdate transport system substrate-binding protein
MSLSSRRAVAVIGVILAALSAPVPVAAQETVMVYAAASLKNALDAINAAFTAKTGIKTVASYAASSTLVRQIDEGAPADVLLSADLEWMAYASRRKLVRDDSHIDLLGNQLVLIAPSDSSIAPVTIAPGFDLAALAGGGRIVTGDVRSVPVGIYAKAALEKLGVWSSVQAKIAMAENVRAALALVARGEAPLGIVYATDAKIEPRVKVIGFFPTDSHSPIVYPAAATAAARPASARYLDYLRSGAAKTIFESYGFAFLPKPTS